MQVPANISMENLHAKLSAVPLGRLKRNLGVLGVGCPGWSEYLRNVYTVLLAQIYKNFSCKKLWTTKTRLVFRIYKGSHAYPGMGGPY